MSENDESNEDNIEFKCNIIIINLGDMYNSSKKEKKKIRLDWNVILMQFY